MSDVLIDEVTLLRLQKLAALGEVSAGISHETRNLLTAIVGFAQVASQRSKTLDTAVHYLGLVQREAKRCITLLEHQLGLAKVDAEPPKRTDAAEVVREVATAAGYQAELKRVTIEVASTVGPEVAICRGDLQQVLLNLVLNALHASPVGSRIGIAMRHAGEIVEITVTDAGAGVPAAIRASIFDPFFTTKGVEGTGLGLAVCRQLVDGCGGSLRLDETYVQGARFVLTLPVPQ
jgi:signal transduction histidine kinase